MNVAQLATDRLLRGLPFTPPKDAVFEDYVKVWLQDLALQIQMGFKKGGMVNPDELNGLMNLGKTIGSFLDEMARNEDEKDKVQEYQKAFGKLMNHLTGFEQRLQQQMKAQAGAQQPGGNGDPQGAAKVQSTLILAQTKAAIAERSAAAKLAQKDKQFQAGEKRKDVQTQADIQRSGVVTRHELLANRLKALAETELSPETPAQ